MFFFARQREAAALLNCERAATSLGLFAGNAASSASVGDDFFADLPIPRSRLQQGWRPPLSPSGWPVLFHGWIDNSDELIDLLKLPPTTGAPELYGAAVERWGDSADERIKGSYASLVCLPDGDLRLARSPWGGRALFYWQQGKALVASSILRPMFAAGLPKRLRAGALEAMLTFDLQDPQESRFEGIHSLLAGTVMKVGPDGVRLHRYYDPMAIPKVRFRKDSDYVEAANALLSDAVRVALKGVERPAVTLSGGLDSALVCDEVLRQRGDRKITSITFGPLDEWDGSVPSHKFGDDRPAVREFASQHRDLDAIFVDNRGIDWDYREQERFLAGDGFYPGQTLGSVYYGLFEAAKLKNCDWLLFAGAGNTTLSNDAPWAIAEFLRTGRFIQAWNLAASRLNDSRSVTRRLLALGLIPNLPSRPRAFLRRIVHGPTGSDFFANYFLRSDSRIKGAVRSRTGEVTIYSDGDIPSREAFIRRRYAVSGIAGELWETDEQVFGIQSRDVLVYQPLIEFCFGLPTTQFAKDGETRRLARRMAIGRMPEAQRINRLYGEHNVDWHARLSARLPEIRTKVERIARHPELGDLIDTQLMFRLLDSWPDRTPDDPRIASLLRFALPSMISTAKYLDYLSGRNES